MVDGISVTKLLVTAVTLVLRGSQNGDFEIRVRGLVAHAVPKRLVTREIVDDQNLNIFAVKRRRYAAQNLADRRLGIVGDYENELAFFAQCEAIVIGFMRCG